jgi:hypothetical protein
MLLKDGEMLGNIELKSTDDGTRKRLLQETMPRD